MSIKVLEEVTLTPVSDEQATDAPTQGNSKTAPIEQPAEAALESDTSS